MTSQPSVQDLLNEEARLVLDRFDFGTAWTLGTKIRELAVRDSLPVAIDIWHGGTMVFASVMPGATSDNLDWTRRKRAVALRFHHSSLYMRVLSEAQGVDFNVRFRVPPADFVASGGAIPLQVKGAGVVAVAAVSGLPDVEDHRLIVRALEELGMVPSL